MTDEAWKALTIIVPTSTTILAGLFYRVWSHIEHRGNNNDVRELKIYFNGELEKRLEAAREEGRKEATAGHQPFYHP